MRYSEREYKGGQQFRETTACSSAGAQFTYADCAAYVHLPLIVSASKTVLGEDALAVLAGLKDYLSRVRERPSAAQADAERKASLDEFLAYRAEQHASAPP